jgi:hypothetical protein
LKSVEESRGIEFASCLAWLEMSPEILLYAPLLLLSAAREERIKESLKSALEPSNDENERNLNRNRTFTIIS